MINYLTQNNLDAYNARQAERRQWEAAEFKRQMVSFIPEQERAYIEIRKRVYVETKRQVMRGRLPGAVMCEFEIWKGF